MVLKMPSIRPVLETDIARIKRFHMKYFRDLEFPDFRRLLCGFVIQNKDGKFLMAGGVQLKGEAILVTDVSQDKTQLGRALVIAQGACIHTCQRFNVDELLAFVDNNPGYVKHLIQHGFQERDEKVLSMQVPNG